MLPEFLDDHGEYKVNVSPPALSGALEELGAWLIKKENESSRQVRPAWIEVVLALIALTEKQLAQSESAYTGYDFAFETHIVAKQVAKQRKERQLPTRFVTDEIKRIAHHQANYLNDANVGQTLAVVGWYRLANKRGLGLAVLARENAVDLCLEESEGSDKGIAMDSNSGLNKTGIRAIFLRYLLVGNILLLFVNLIVITLTISRERSELNTPFILNSIEETNTLRCGVDGLLPHFSLRNDAEQTWWGLDVELCRALGAALDVNVEFVKVSDSQFEKRIEALINRKVDILFRNTSHTIARDLNRDVTFGPNYLALQ